MTIERVRNFLSNERNGGRGQDPEALLRKLLSLNGECAYCGHPMEREGWDAIDHVQPVFDGGTGQIDNLLPVCVACNAEKGQFNADGWYHRLSTQRPNWPGALHQQAVEVRAAHGYDEDTFLALRASTIAQHGEGREREDERRAREEAARRAAEAEAERERDMARWRNANQQLIDAEVERRLSLIPPKVVEKEVEHEVERKVEVYKTRPWKKLVAIGVVAALAAFGSGTLIPTRTVTKIVTEKVNVPGPVVWKTKTVPVVKWKTRTVYKTVSNPVAAPAEPASSSSGSGKYGS